MRSSDTLGPLEREVGIGDVWRWGSAVLQVTQPRWPCFKRGMYRGREDVGGRVRVSGRAGWYLRVLEPGEVAAHPALAEQWRASILRRLEHLAAR